MDEIVVAVQLRMAAAGSGGVGGGEIAQIGALAALAADLPAERLRVGLPEIDVDPDEPSGRHVAGDVGRGDHAPAAVAEVEPFDEDAG